MSHSDVLLSCYFVSISTDFCLIVTKTFILLNWQTKLCNVDCAWHKWRWGKYASIKVTETWMSMVNKQRIYSSVVISVSPERNVWRTLGSGGSWQLFITGWLYTTVVTEDETLKYYCYGVMRKSVPTGTRFVAISTARCTTTHYGSHVTTPKPPLACNTRFFLKTGSRKITALLSNSQLWKLSIKIK